MPRWVSGVHSSAGNNTLQRGGGVSLGQVKGGGVAPRVAVEAESNMENSMLWRQPEEEDI